MSKRYLQLAFALTLTTALVACGGGGGGGGGSSSTSTSPSVDPVAAALVSGDARGVSKSQVVSSLSTLFTEQASSFASTKQSLFGLNADGSPNANNATGIDWDPSANSIYFNVLDGSRNQTVIGNNWVYTATPGASSSNMPLAVVGSTTDSTARYAALGGQPFSVRGNAAMDQLVRNMVSWLTKRNSFTGFKVVVAHLPSGAENTTRTWLANNYAGLSINGVSTNPASQSDGLCDNAQLATCLQNADLLVIGHDSGSGYNGDTVMAAVNAAQARGVPVMYVHGAWSTPDLSKRILASFSLASANTSQGNFYARFGIKAYDASALGALPGNMGAIQTLINRLEQGTFSSTWSGCVNDTGRVSCSNDTTYMAEFGTVTDSMRTKLRTLDGNATAIFASGAGYSLERLLVLLGDKYRTDVAYASTFTKTSDPIGFYRALFSDTVSYSTRGYNTVASNLGNFSGMFAANTSTGTHTVSVTVPVSGTKEYPTGLYVLPGRSVTLTRTDVGTGTVKFGVNMLRDTTRVFQQFDRPTQLASPRPGLAGNTPVTITNPYGGPLFLFIDAAAGQPAVTVRVEGVITHPVLRNPNNAAEVASFTNEVNSTPTNWVIIATDALMIHSTKDHFLQSVSNTDIKAINYSGSVSALVTDTWNYTVKGTYELAGFNNESGSLTQSSTVSNFCAAKGWDCTGTQHRRDTMQHVISDVYAFCGAGCSGNPYDENWAFIPLGWGESHEIGHNLQRDRLKIYAGISTEASNNIFPNHNRILYNTSVNSVRFVDRDTIGTSQPGCNTASMTVGACVFSLMTNAQSQANPTTTMYNALWSDSTYAANNSSRVMFYRQLVEYARYYSGANLGDGWAVYTLMYLLERNFSNASGNWSSVNAGYGFGTYGSYPSSINGNDFMLIASSFIIGKDMRPMFDLWGITYSASASAQVAAHGYTAVAKLFFPMAQLSTLSSGIGTPVTVTSSATYPAGY